MTHGDEHSTLTLHLPLGYFDDKTFVMHTRVYFHDTDAAGIVYHGTYLHFAERARTEMLRHLKVDPDWLWQEHRLALCHRLRGYEVSSPALHDDFVTIRTQYLQDHRRAHGVGSTNECE